jgi:hypothetical protein
MKKSYLTDEQITYFVKRGNSILTPSDFKKIHSIASKYGFTLTASKQSNLQMWWNAIFDQIDQLSPSDSFRANYEQGLRTWHLRKVDNTIIIAYMKHKNIYESEYMLLASPKWDELNSYIISELGSAGVDTDGGNGIFIGNSGDYYGYIFKYAKKYADPESIKASENLKKILDNLIKDLSPTERGTLVSVIQQYLTAFDRPLDFDTLHNLLYKGQ